MNNLAENKTIKKISYMKSAALWFLLLYEKVNQNFIAYDLRHCALLSHSYDNIKINKHFVSLSPRYIVTFAISDLITESEVRKRDDTTAHLFSIDVIS